MPNKQHAKLGFDQARLAKQHNPDKKKFLKDVAEKVKKANQRADKEYVTRVVNEADAAGFNVNKKIPLRKQPALLQALSLDRNAAYKRRLKKSDEEGSDFRYTK